VLFAKSLYEMMGFSFVYTSLKQSLKKLGSVSAMSLNSTSASSRMVSSSFSSASMTTYVVSGRRVTNCLVSFFSAICRKLDVA